MEFRAAGSTMNRLLVLAVVGVVAVLCLIPAPARASTLASCLDQQHVCVAADGRNLISRSQEASLERQISGDDIYLVVAASGSGGYNQAMSQIIADLNGHKQFTVGFLDARSRHFGAYNKGMLPRHAAANIATNVVREHQADQDIFAALTSFVRDVQTQAACDSAHLQGCPARGTPAQPHSRPSHTLTYALIAVGLVVVLASAGIFLIVRPIRKRKRRELKEAKSAAQDDLIALSNGITDHDSDLGVRNSPEAA